MRGHVNAPKLIGQKTALKVPAPTPSPKKSPSSRNREVLSGVPAKAEEYKLTAGPCLPQGLSRGTRPRWATAEVPRRQHSAKCRFDSKISVSCRNAGLPRRAKAKPDQWVKSREAELVEPKMGAD